jgi:phosphoketolase
MTSLDWINHFRINPDERPSNGLSEAMMKIKRAQGVHPRRAKFDFHTNPDERPSNGLSEASMKISQAQVSALNGRRDIFILILLSERIVFC